MADRRPYGLVLPPLDESALPRAAFGESGRWTTLAQSLAANLRHAAPGPATVVVRPDASPSLAVLGWATAEERAALETALDAFVGSLARLRYVDYAQTEADCGVLAERLRDRLPASVLDDAVFAGIPRGGTIVRGMLSYALDLSPEQLAPQARPEALLVVVDDCFLTGYRAGRFLENRPSRSDVVLAGLYAHPDLRAAVERDRPSVRACVTARDLDDHAPRLYGDDYADWKARCEARLRGPRYWIGCPDHLCFAWSEPDAGVSSASAEHVSRTWDVVPARHCLERRHRQEAPPDGPPVTVTKQHVPDDQPVRPGPDVFYAEEDGRVLVAEASTDACVVLDGPAADFWSALLEHGTVAAARRVLLSRFDASRDTLAADLRDFVATAVGRNLLHHSADATASS